MSRYIVSLKNFEYVKRNYVYPVVKEDKSRVAIINDKKQIQWLEEKDIQYFRIMY